MRASAGPLALGLGVLLTIGGTACELVVGTHDRELIEGDAALPDTGPEASYVEEASVIDDATSDAGLEDDGIYAEEPPITFVGDACVPPAACYDDATTCASACHDRSVACQAQCRNSTCRQRCRHDEIDCKAVCETACGTCTTASGCYDPDGCAALTL